MESVSTPRVSMRYLDGYVGKNVMIVGKVLQLRGDTAIIECDGNLSVLLNREAHLTPDHGAQIIGKVNNDLSVKALSALDLGPNVDYNGAQSVVEATQNYKDLFIFQN